MIGSKIAVDTNIFIDVMKGNQLIAEKIRSFEELYISPIVLEELHFGAYRSVNPERQLVKINHDPDIWIASAAIQHQIPLYTNDRHFERIDGLILN
jgi:tRNA(fMet)-specific endonuclease VapC